MIRKEEKGILYTTLFMMLQQGRDKKMRACTATEKFLCSGAPVGTVKQHYLPPCSSEQLETNPYAKKTDSRTRRVPVSKTCAAAKSIKDYHDEDPIKERKKRKKNKTKQNQVIQ